LQKIYKFGWFIMDMDNQLVGWKIQFELSYYRRVRVEETGPMMSEIRLHE
jgi:hypothetical protein